MDYGRIQFDNCLIPSSIECKEEFQYIRNSDNLCMSCDKTTIIIQGTSCLMQNHS